LSALVVTPLRTVGPATVGSLASRLAWRHGNSSVMGTQQEACPRVV
jgi:hypothetical protein